MRHTSGRRESEFMLVYKFLGERESRSVEAASLSELLGKIARGAESRKSIGVTGRRVLVEKKEPVLA